MNRGEVLDIAKELVFGARAQEYGPPKENFERIATIWSLIMKTKVTAAQVALCMMGLKMTRLMETENHPDSWIDIAGYAGCGGEITHAVHATK